VAIDTVMAADPKKLTAAIRRGLEDPRYAHAFAELIGKVTREIGADAAHDVKPVVFHFYTNLNPLALAGPNSPARRSTDVQPSGGAGAPGLPVQAGGRRRPSPAEDRSPFDWSLAGP